MMQCILTAFLTSSRMLTLHVYMLVCTVIGCQSQMVHSRSFVESIVIRLQDFFVNDFFAFASQLVIAGDFLSSFI